jgi:hypothetical protein
MNSFNIAMGQGVVAAADLQVFTDALLSCTFIAGHNASGSVGGAFHYPAESLEAVSDVMHQWLVTLRPVAITLVFAHAVSFGMGTTEADKARLRNWLRQRCPHINPASTNATAACMSLAGGEFYAGTVGGDLYWDDTEGTDLMTLEPGPHAQYHLFDARPYLNAGGTAVVQEETTPKKKKRRFSKMRCIVM